MKIEINESSIIIKNILISLKRETVNKYKFDGKIKNGQIEGYFSSFGLMFSSLNPSLLKIKGVYDLKVGKLVLTTSPSNVLYSTLLFAFLTMIIPIIYYFFRTELVLTDLLLFGILSLFLFIGFYIGLIFSNRTFKKHIKSLVVYQNCDDAH